MVEQQYKMFRRFLDSHLCISRFDESPVYNYDKNNCQFIVLLNGGQAFNRIIKKETSMIGP